MSIALKRDAHTDSKQCVHIAKVALQWWLIWSLVSWPVWVVWDVGQIVVCITGFFCRSHGGSAQLRAFKHVQHKRTDVPDANWFARKRRLSTPAGYLLLYKETSTYAKRCSRRTVHSIANARTTRPISHIMSLRLKARSNDPDRNDS